ncbi:EfeM/EfeO family lipoprotein [Wohlfahrtiimonas larvae]|uniref:Imelysin-like domain-containing protein n=1 Tax=Wohlfahrtiimonas larvae TaxID=1157986 RepID=A0ABP9MT09_9GAMM|nr:EfeM/EfeO family lipoprotein [Wohlfahrtiimonas larvae]
MDKKIISLCILILSTTFGNAKVGRQAILQSSDQPPIVALGDIPNPKQFQPAIDAYMKIATERMRNIETLLTQLSEALEHNDLTSAQQKYIEAHYQYETIRPVVLVFGNIDRMINSRAEAFLAREQDPNFKGFHAVEYELFAQKNVEKALLENQKLLKNVKDLAKRVAIETIFLPKLVQSAPDFAENILENKLSGHDNIYSGADLGEIVANLEGIDLVITQLQGFIPQELLQTTLPLDIKIRSRLQKYMIDTGFMPYSALTNEDKHELYGDVSALAEQLAKLRSILKVQVYHQFNGLDIKNEEK